MPIRYRDSRFIGVQADLYTEEAIREFKMMIIGKVTVTGIAVH